MAKQGGTHEQHVKAGEQSHKNSGRKSAASSSGNKSSGNDSKGGAKSSAKSK